ncbi:hypothetical protein R5R35_002527 [Gryllus longicercus]|uniref:Uncharacterized protein n=1 Tax=Gryllus longicercus TaxID=2509291 RepID=A0AAN9ZAA6_9ORTH
MSSSNIVCECENGMSGCAKTLSQRDPTSGPSVGSIFTLHGICTVRRSLVLRNLKIVIEKDASIILKTVMNGTFDFIAQTIRRAFLWLTEGLGFRSGWAQIFTVSDNSFSVCLCCVLALFHHLGNNCS